LPEVALYDIMNQKLLHTVKEFQAAFSAFIHSTQQHITGHAGELSSWRVSGVAQDAPATI